MFYACKSENKSKIAVVSSEEIVTPFFEISLAQWSLNRAFRSKKLPPMDFAKKAKELGFTAVEYVSGLYTSGMKEEDKSVMIPQIAKKLKEQSDLYGIKNVLIMIDGEGDLAHSDKLVRDKAIENHVRWLNAAVTLGCTSIRVNLSPNRSISAADWHTNSVDGLGRLVLIAAKMNINVIVENHGGFSSDGAKLAAVMAVINKPNCGTLPDFGNFCISRDAKGACSNLYDMYKGVSELMPYAKGVSAKSYEFDADGNETKIDYVKMLRIVKDAGYTGHIGIEYEGGGLSEEEGIIATKKLLLKAASKL